MNQTFSIAAAAILRLRGPGPGRRRGFGAGQPAATTAGPLDPRGGRAAGGLRHTALPPAAATRLSRSVLSGAGRTIAASLLLAAAFGAAAQSHQVRRGDLVLQSSTVGSTRIDADTAAYHGIEPAPTRAVLNVVLLRGKDREPVPAAVTASYRGLTGRESTVDMREVRANGRVSYIGSYEFLPRQVLDFTIVARPLHPDGAKPLTLRYRERMWGIGDKANP